MSKKKTEEENYKDWVSTRLLDDNYVSTYTSDILDKPRFVLSSTTSDYDKELLYTTEQMLEMFRAGFLSMSRTDVGKRALAKKKINEGPRPYNRIRQMHVGEKVTFPYKRWAATRVAASKVHSEFGSTFRVTKLSSQGEIGDIEVTRLT